jgi:hypothetical protein
MSMIGINNKESIREIPKSNESVVQTMGFRKCLNSDFCDKMMSMIPKHRNVGNPKTKGISKQKI